MVGLVRELVVQMHDGRVGIVCVHRLVVEVINQVLLVVLPCLSVRFRRKEARHSIVFEQLAESVRCVAQRRDGVKVATL